MAYPTIQSSRGVVANANRCLAASATKPTITATTNPVSHMGMDMYWARSEVHPNPLRMLGIKNEVEYAVMLQPKYITKLDSGELSTNFGHRGQTDREKLPDVYFDV